MRLIQKPSHIMGYSFSSGLIGSVFGQNPSSARSINELPPATMDIPSVWANRNIGNAQREFDSRMNMLIDRDSSQLKRASMCARHLCDDRGQTRPRRVVLRV